MPKPTQNLEQTLSNYRILKKNFNIIFEEKNKMFSAITTLDKEVVGFELSKKYTIVSFEGMASITFLENIIENMKLFYSINLNYYTIENNLTNLKEELTMFNLYILPKETTEREGHEKRPQLEDVPKEIQDNSDVIIAIYRPEYYEIDNWDDDEQTSTHNQIEFAILKNHKVNLMRRKLILDKENKKVKSIKKAFILKKWAEKNIELLNNK